MYVHSRTNLILITDSMGSVPKILYLKIIALDHAEEIQYSTLFISFLERETELLLQTLAFYIMAIHIKNVFVRPHNRD